MCVERAVLENKRKRSHMTCTVSVVTSISYRSDAASDEALHYLERSTGLNRSQAIREALIEAADRRRREALIAEVEALAHDEVDQQEKAAIGRLMESLAPPAPAE